MRLENYLEEKFAIEITQLENKGHNKHFRGISKSDSNKFFIKVYEKEELYWTEKNIYQLNYKENLLYAGKFENRYIIIIKYYHMERFSWEKGENLQAAAKALASYHKNSVTLPSIKQIKLFEELNIKYNKIKEVTSPVLDDLYNFFLQKQNMICNEEKIIKKHLVHGDFGIRNIGLVDGEVIVFDFERSALCTQWYDFVKIFNSEITSKEQQDQFLKYYQEVNTLENISEDMYKLLVFLELLGIESYCRKHDAYELKKIGNKILDSLVLYVKENMEVDFEVK